MLGHGIREIDRYLSVAPLPAFRVSISHYCSICGVSTTRPRSTTTSPLSRPLAIEVFTIVKSVLIAEDHALTRQAICSVLASTRDSMAPKCLGQE